MCGFSGIVISKNIVSKYDLKSIVNNSVNAIKYRGPDQTKVIIEEIDEFYICVGFNRLSILDISENSMQPINLKNSISAFNGEIYNYNYLSNKKYYSDTLFLKDF